MFDNARDGIKALFAAIIVLAFAGCSEIDGVVGAGQTQSSAIDNDAPALVNNTGSVVGEGGIHTIHAAELFYRDSVQSTSSVRITVTSPPRDGQLEMILDPGKPISQFTQADIDADRIVYKHVRGHTASDVFEFDVDDSLGNTLSAQRFTISVIPNISSLNLVFSDSMVHLSWINSLSKDFAGVMIRRRDDGHYPESPTDGVLVYKSQSGEQQAGDLVTSDTSNGPLTHYYTIFSYSENGAYSDGVRTGLYCDPWGGCISVPELRKLNRLQSSADMDNLRKTLIHAIWGVETLPGGLPDIVTARGEDWRYTNALNLMTIQIIAVQMDYGLTSDMRFYSPIFSNNKLVVYHQGHDGNTYRNIDLIQRFLQEGFHVLEVSMPLTGYNENPSLPFSSGVPGHDEMASLDRPMRFFFEPISVGLNYLTSVQNYEGIYMVGISGGGWTTVVYAALDPRISASYPVAGSYPFYLRDQLGWPTFGDFEQRNPDFFQHVSYEELYLLGAAGRRQLQIYNKFDICCFGGTYSNTFKDYLLKSADQIGGSLDIAIDDTFTGHEISDFSLERILSDMTVH
jgi:hypothetical protein